MQFSIIAIIFLYGIVIGSFVNVIIYRVPRKLGVSRGRSFCPSCEHKLAFYDLVPVFSYLFLRGKCRYCGAKISVRYPLVELLNGVLYLAVVWKYGLTLAALGWLIAVPILIAVAFIDAEHRIIPDRLSIAIALSSIIMMFSNSGPDIISRVIGLFSVSVPFLLIGLLSGGRAMGGGDMKLMAAVGLCLGWELNIMALFLGALMGSVVSVIKMVQGKVGRKTQVPFGPYLVAGIIAAALFGDFLFTAYVGLFK